MYTDLCIWVGRPMPPELDAEDSDDYLIRSHSIQILLRVVNLTTLAIMSAVGIDLDDATPNADSILPQTSLTYMNMDYSPISAPTPVARFLSAIFSGLAQIGTSREYDDNDDPQELLDHAEAIGFHYAWKEVHSLIPHFLAVRAEERTQRVE
ncbi:hypothetical protein B0H17DRAFT_1204864 [Mycena rosella]|uniref:Uncharacterized protein n=1 Tax=Mycena rosella TaxID=1033263 RepID=A0AAD7GES5_MYCRO|nr:hypothetical protein B0H17DRAFT_1204864 [Mycena rosella]